MTLRRRGVSIPWRWRWPGLRPPSRARPLGCSGGRRGWGRTKRGRDGREEVKEG
jgi:hypothetical protein